MDTSFWIQCNPKISVGHTTKKYYGKFLYKLVLYVPASRLIHSKGSIAEELHHRKAYNLGGSWSYSRFVSKIDQADITLLGIVRDIKLDKNLNIKLRAEEPRVQLYANTEQDLQHVIKTYLADYYSHIESITGPEDADAAAILDTGAIIKKNDIGYRYKVLLKDGRYDLQTKKQIMEYLSNLGPDLAYVPRGTLDALSRNTTYIWNSYFYCNDDNVNVFINLISPGMVSNCHELVILPHK
jgi:hypothetical protein